MPSNPDYAKSTLALVVTSPWKIGLFALLAFVSSAGLAQDPELGPIFQVKDSRGGAVAVGPNEGFVIVWFDYELGVRGKRYDSNGDQLGEEFQISGNSFARPSSPADGGSRHPAIGMDSASKFVVAWNNSEGVAARRFDSTGEPLGDEFQVNTETPAGLQRSGGTP